MIDYLAHSISPGRHKVTIHATDATHDLNIPTTQTKLHSIIGLCDVFNWCVPSFASIVSPSTGRLRWLQEKELGQLDEEELTALRTLQEKLISPPALALPGNEGSHIFDTDAWDRQIGCVLLRKQDNNVGRPIVYWSKIVNNGEKNIDTTLRECLAVVWAILILSPYLGGTNFTVRTDQHALKWIFNFAEAT